MKRNQKAKKGEMEGGRKTRKGRRKEGDSKGNWEKRNNFKTTLLLRNISYFSHPKRRKRDSQVPSGSNVSLQKETKERRRKKKKKVKIKSCLVKSATHGVCLCKEISLFITNRFKKPWRREM